MNDTLRDNHKRLVGNDQLVVLGDSRVNLAIPISARVLPQPGLIHVYRDISLPNYQQHPVVSQS